MLKFSVNHTADRKNRLMDKSKLQKMKKKNEKYRIMQCE